jgi:hypothetical protein
MNLSDANQGHRAENSWEGHIITVNEVATYLRLADTILLHPEPRPDSRSLSLCNSIERNLGGRLSQ